MLVYRRVTVLRVFKSCTRWLGMRKKDDCKKWMQKKMCVNLVPMQLVIGILVELTTIVSFLQNYGWSPMLRHQKAIPQITLQGSKSEDFMRPLAFLDL